MSNDILDDFNEEKKKKPYVKKLLNVLFYFISFLVALGLVARLMHWPYSKQILVSSLGFAALWYVVYLVNKYTND
jgi:heme A synthase